jgi:hypothetical protein
MNNIQEVYYRIFFNRMTKLESDALAEAYTTVSNMAQKIFYDAETSQDTYDFLKSIATQLNLYRVALIKNQK